MSKTKSPWFTDIEEVTLENKDWRKVLHTSDNMQVVVMSVPPKEDLGWEMHRESDQFFRIEGGRALVEIEKGKHVEEIELEDGGVTVIPHGTWHNVSNTGRKPLQFYTIYSPPHHPPRRHDKRKCDERRHK